MSIEKINNIAIGSISHIDNIATGSISNVSGIAVPTTSTYSSVNSLQLDGSNDYAWASLPSGWGKSQGSYAFG